MTPKQRESRAQKRLRFLRKIGWRIERDEFAVFLSSNSINGKKLRVTWFELGAMSANEWNFLLERSLRRPAIVNCHPDIRQLIDGRFWFLNYAATRHFAAAHKNSYVYRETKTPRRG